MQVTSHSTVDMRRRGGFSLCYSSFSISIEYRIHPRIYPFGCQTRHTHTHFLTYQNAYYQNQFVLPYALLLYIWNRLESIEHIYVPWVGRYVKQFPGLANVLSASCIMRLLANAHKHTHTHSIMLPVKCSS